MTSQLLWFACFRILLICLTGVCVCGSERSRWLAGSDPPGFPSSAPDAVSPRTHSLVLLHHCLALTLPPSRSPPLHSPSLSLSVPYDLPPLYSPYSSLPYSHSFAGPFTHAQVCDIRGNNNNVSSLSYCCYFGVISITSNTVFSIITIIMIYIFDQRRKKKIIQHLHARP